MDKLDYHFTDSQDWFSPHIPSWRALFSSIISPAPRALEIGSWEGRSAVFTLTNLGHGDSSIVCVDHFDTFRTEAGRERHRKISHNLGLTQRPHRIMPQFSVPALVDLLKEATHESDPGFDWIYIDGSHEAADTFLDGELAWRLARQGAIFVFDDYRWSDYPLDSAHHPKPGVDAFIALHRGEFEILAGTEPKHYQMVLRKTVPMNIGFSFDIASEVQNANSGSVVNISLAFDSEYAMPAAVTILSSIEATPGPIEIHVLDCGLSADDLVRIQSLVPKSRSDVSISFIQLPGDSLTQELGPLWSKMDVIGALSADRTLYLDADVLVRKDLRPLWAMDLDSKLLAAAPDVEHPFGHPSVLERVANFNAGVLLVDLAKVRMSMTSLVEMARRMKNSYFADQDVLNLFFRDKWLEISLSWNATGLGTYAERLNPERATLRLQEMTDPAIVHFTGPLHPPMSHVINPWVQPCLAKPWGYAGAGGNPYEEEWWAVLKNTAWSEWRGSSEHVAIRRRKAEDAHRIETEHFWKKLGLESVGNN